MATTALGGGWAGRRGIPEADVADLKTVAATVMVGGLQWKMVMVET